MKRRKFLEKTALGIGGMMVFSNVSAIASVNSTQSLLVPLNAAMPQIRHGALSLPQLNLTDWNPKTKQIPFEWLGEIRRNLFFKNGFQKNELEEEEDLEIISVMYNDVRNDEKEALQIQCSQLETNLLVKDELYSVQKQEGIVALKKSVENQENAESLSLSVGVLEAGKEYNHTFNPNSELFVYLLEGNVQINKNELFSDFGLAINGTKELVFFAKENSKLLIFENKKNI